MPIKNKEKKAEANRRYYEKHKEKSLEYQKKYYQVNREKVLETVHEYRESNRDLIRERQRQEYREKLVKRLYSSAKRRAEIKGMDFNIEESDIVVPEKCPLLEIDLFVGKGSVHKNSPSLDRIDPSKGYIKGNVMVISYKANTIKSNATPSEILRLVSNLIKHIHK
jgi:hypothetical protein